VAVRCRKGKYRSLSSIVIASSASAHQIRGCAVPANVERNENIQVFRDAGFNVIVRSHGVTYRIGPNHPGFDHPVEDVYRLFHFQGFGSAARSATDCAIGGGKTQENEGSSMSPSARRHMPIASDFDAFRERHSG
jgi:hypothetical protein